ncbi:FG-GAP-like repeat-containing protein [Streptomyces sp. NPDC050121]|uniref:FG-GAP-like repeat-containing protein n=1 Tax=Streptomyces sp. NPDC050121 TaxID=3365601 RepID=UPI0037AB8D4B
MPTLHQRRRRRRIGGQRPATAAVAAALALAASLLATQTADRASAASVGAATTAQSTAESRALAKAVTSGEPVEVIAHRTETVQVFANPDGSFTQDTYALAQFVRKDRKLVPIDTALKANADGTFSPAATEVGVKFSGGGEGPLATVTRDGRSLSIGWPKPLPKPVVDGDTITYANVLNDVDLKLKANSAGFNELLVVKSAAAADDPALATISLPLSTAGLTAAADDHGNLRVTNPAGQEVFTAPTPRMWDSSTTQASTQTLAHTAQESSSGPQTTDEFEPGPGAQQAAVPVAVTAHELKLTPDADVMTGQDTTYPVYIDPYVEGSRYSWTIAYKKTPTTAYYNGAGFNGGTTTARAGYENETNGLARSYFRMNTKNLWSTNKQVTKSTFRIKNTWSWSCTAKPVELWRTSAITSSTTWNNRPARQEKMATVTDAKGWSSSCPAGNLAFNVTGGAQDAAAGKWSTITFELAASNESDVYGWKKFDAKSAVLSTEYNTVPNAPTGLDTSPSVGGCDTAAPYSVIGNTDVYLTAKVSDADGGTVKAEFRLWGSNNLSSGSEIFDQTVSVTSGTVARARVPKATLAAKETVAHGTFVWKVRAYDGAAYSAWTPTTTCGFGFDSTRPSNPPGVTSTEFPDGSDGWPAVTGSVRTKGTFTLSGAGITDVTKYEYWTDTDPTVRTATPGSAGGNVNVTFTPTNAGTNHLYARSLDRAGNKSDTADYPFYANGLKTADKAGDVNGDGNSDLYGIAKDGTLNRFYGAGDGTLTQGAEAAATGNWTGTKITRRGDWTGDGYEDLISLEHDATTDTNRLRIHPNDGSGFACTDCPGTGKDQRELTVYDDANNHWSNGVKQILAVGDVDGPLDIDADGTPDTPGYPDLVVNDGTFVWLYYGNSDDRLDSDRDPVLLGGPEDPLATGTSKINEITLAAPGDWNNDGQADLVVRYDRPDVGGLWVFHGVQDDNGYDIGVTNRTTIGTNWSTSTVPTFTAAPDADNDGKLDLWAMTPNSGRIRAFRGITASGTEQVTVASEAFTGYQAIG